MFASRSAPPANRRCSSLRASTDGDTLRIGLLLASVLDTRHDRTGHPRLQMAYGRTSPVGDADRRRSSRRRQHMAIVGGFDLHRRRITFDYLSTETGGGSSG